MPAGKTESTDVGPLHASAPAAHQSGPHAMPHVAVQGQPITSGKGK